MKTNITGLLAVLAAACSSTLLAQHFDEPSVMNQPYTQLVPDNYFGDYEGTYSPGEGVGAPASLAATAKVVPQGDRFYAVVLKTRSSDPDEVIQVSLQGRRDGERLTFSGSSGGHDWEGEAGKQSLRVQKKGYAGLFEMKRVSKKSPTEGLKPPQGAVVLLANEPGRKPGLEMWNEAGWITTTEGVMHKNPGSGPRPDLPRMDISTKKEYRNLRLHVEFRLPYEPDLREQARGNSGVIFNDRYEVQVLDSFGLVPGTGDCASIYGVAPPRVNAAFPPLSWQTFDITFYAPVMDSSGKLTRPPSMTVLWNGIKVHDNQTMPTPTGDAARANAMTGPLRIQDHGNLVYYRNIWAEELPDQERP